MGNTHEPARAKDSYIRETEDYEKDSNFHKLFLKNNFKKIENIEKALNGIANKKTMLCVWIASNLTRDNHLLYTYRQIADKTHNSYKTVADTMKILLEKDFMRRLGSGHYMVNPDILFKGKYSRRCIAFSEYSGLPKSRELLDTQEAYLKNIQSNIARLEKQKKKLEDKITSLKRFDDKTAEKNTDA